MDISKAKLPQNTGGLAVPDLVDFWNSLKLAWLTRLIQSDDGTIWKRLSMSNLSTALKITNLSTIRLLGVSPQAIASAARALSNPFWQNLLILLPTLESTFYSLNPKLIGEHPIWDRKDVLKSNGKPFDKKTAPAQMLEFNTFSNFISGETNVLMRRRQQGC